MKKPENVINHGNKWNPQGTFGKTHCKNSYSILMILMHIMLVPTWEREIAQIVNQNKE